LETVKSELLSTFSDRLLFLQQNLEQWAIIYQITSALYLAMGVLFWFIGTSQRQDFDPVSSSSSAQILDADSSSVNPSASSPAFDNGSAIVDNKGQQNSHQSNTARININNGELKVGYNAVDGRTTGLFNGSNSDGGGVTNVGFVAEDVDTVDSRFDSPR
jgi:hypothetical protein